MNEILEVQFDVLHLAVSIYTSFTTLVLVHKICAGMSVTMLKAKFVSMFSGFELHALSLKRLSGPLYDVMLYYSEA